jgi:glycosyltransferase involved in cell wall biosynthesis
MVAQGLAGSGVAMRICLVYDCLFPYTVGGAERWYRNLGERLAAEGHEVTYLTLRQWGRGDSADVKGVQVVAVGPRLALYTPSGRRRIWPPLVFGLGVLVHLLAKGRRYDVVHTASFPYFSLLAAATVRPLRGFRLVVDWHEVWTREYWIEYLGSVGGRVGALVQRACLRVPHRAFCFSRLHARRIREGGFRAEPTVLEGEYNGPLEPQEPEVPDRYVMFAGRHIPEKRVPALIPAMAVVRRTHPGVHCVVFGDGPERPRVDDLVRELGLHGAITVPGFVDASEVERSLRRSACLVLPSRREGYGMIVIEAAAAGTPSVVVNGDDNAATELVEEGVNGFIAVSAGPEDLAQAINRVLDGGMRLRQTTARWFGRNARRLSLESSLERVAEAYAAEANLTD